MADDRSPADGIDPAREDGLAAPVAVKRLLIVDDEPAILQGLEDTFLVKGYDVTTATDGDAALATASAGDFDAILLDLMLPGIDGFEICRRLRAAGSRVPIIMLTARGAEEDKIIGLEIGADDYVTKPFSVRELVARIEALLRRAALPATLTAGKLTFGAVEIDVNRLEGTRDGAPFKLTPREGAIISYLDRHRARVVRRDELLTEVWGYPNGAIETRTVDIHMAKLRKKVERDPADPDIVITVRGEGYKLGAAD